MSYPITSFSKGDAANIVLIISIATFIIHIIIQIYAMMNNMTELVQLERKTPIVCLLSERSPESGVPILSRSGHDGWMASVNVSPLSRAG